MIRISLKHKDRETQTFKLDQELLAGRDPACSIVISEPTVSRQHARFRISSDRCLIEDLESKGGTFVNDRRVSKAVELLEGDVVRIGPASLTINYGGTNFRDDDTQQVRIRDTPRHSRRATHRLAIDSDDFSITHRFLRTEGVAPDSEVIAKQLDALLQIATNINRLVTRPELFREVAKQLLDFFKNADRIIILEADDPSNPTDQKAKLVEHGPHSRLNLPVELSRQVLELCVNKKESVLHENPPQVDQPRCIICAPLWHNQEILGALYLDSFTASFSDDNLRFLSAIGAIVASALKNVLLFEKVEEEAGRRAQLARYFSKDLVERILRNQVPEAQTCTHTRATILMVDICGFSRLTNEVEAPKLIVSLNSYFEAMQRIIFKNKGIVERFGGDSILAYWGVIENDRYAAWRACVAAIAMQNEMMQLNAKLSKLSCPKFRISMGVNTGDVIAGDVGSQQRYEFTVLGDTVNMTRRLEDISEQDQILIGLETARDVGRSALFFELTPKPVKGRKQPLPMAQLFGVRTAANIGVNYKVSVPIELSLTDDSYHGKMTQLRYTKEGESYSVRLTLQLNDEAPPEPGEIKALFAEQVLTIPGSVYGDPMQSTATAYWSTEATAQLFEGPYDVIFEPSEPETLLKELRVI